jgi:hypothetical protein
MHAQNLSKHDCRRTQNIALVAYKHIMQRNKINRERKNKYQREILQAYKKSPRDNGKKRSLTGKYKHRKIYGIVKYKIVVDAAAAQYDA